MDAAQRTAVRSAFVEHGLRLFGSGVPGRADLDLWSTGDTFQAAVRCDMLVACCQDLAWEMRRRRMHRTDEGGRYGGVAGRSWRDVAAAADSLALFCVLMETAEYRYDFKFRSILDVLDTVPLAQARLRDGDGYHLALRAIALLGGDQTRADEGLRLVARAEGSVDPASAPELAEKTLHLCLQALWTYVGRQGASPDVATRLIASADRMLDLGITDSNVYFRRSRGRLVLGDLEGAVRDIDRALELSPEPFLSEQYLSERSEILRHAVLMGQARDAIDDGMVRAREDLVAATDAATGELAEGMKEARDSLHARVDSAVIFNLQLVFTLIAVISIGGLGFGVGKALVESRVTWEAGELERVLLRVCAIVGAFVLVTMVLSVWVLSNTLAGRFPFRRRRRADRQT